MHKIFIHSTNVNWIKSQHRRGCSKNKSTLPANHVPTQLLDVICWGCFTKRKKETKPDVCLSRDSSLPPLVSSSLPWLRRRLRVSACWASCSCAVSSCCLLYKEITNRPLDRIFNWFATAIFLEDILYLYFCQYFWLSMQLTVFEALPLSWTVSCSYLLRLYDAVSILHLWSNNSCSCARDFEVKVHAAVTVLPR